MVRISIVAAKVLGRLRGQLRPVWAKFRRLTWYSKLTISLGFVFAVVLAGLIFVLPPAVGKVVAASSTLLAAGGLLAAHLRGLKCVRLARQWHQATKELAHLRATLSQKDTRLANLERELSQTQIRLETILATVPDIVVEVDRNFVFTAANPAAFRFYGNDLLGREASEFFYYPQPVYNRSQALLCGEAEAIYLEAWLRRRDGACRLIAWHGRALRSPEGQILGIIGVGCDITDLRKLEDELRSKSDLFTAIASAAQDGIVTIDQQGQITFWNHSATRIFGYSAEEAVGKDAHGLLCPPELLPEYEKNFVAFARCGQGRVVGQTLRLEAVRKDGTRVPIELSVGAYRLHGRWCAVAVIRDITKQQALEDSLRESEARYRFLAENIDDIIWTTDSGGRITYVNEAVRSYLGFDPQQLVGQELAVLFPPQAAELVKEMAAGLAGAGNNPGAPTTAIVEHRTAWQGRQVGQVRVKALQDEAGKVRGLLGVSRVVLPTESLPRPGEMDSPVGEFFDTLLSLARGGAKVETLLTQTEQFLKSARLLAADGSVGLCRPGGRVCDPGHACGKHAEKRDPGQTPSGAPLSQSISEAADWSGETVSPDREFGHMEEPATAGEADSACCSMETDRSSEPVSCPETERDKVASANILIPIMTPSGEIAAVLCCEGVVSPPEVRRLVAGRIAPILSLVLAREEENRQRQLLQESLARKARYLRAFLDLGSWCSAIKWDEIVDEQDLLDKIRGVFSQCVPSDYLSGVRVVLFGKTASTEQFCDSLFKLAAPIYWNGQLVGAIEVSLPAARAEQLDSQNWQEEQLYLTHLVNLLSQILGHHLSRFAMATSGYWAAHAFASTAAPPGSGLVEAN